MLPEIARYALYGETGQAVPPDFIHIEDIPSRSELHDWLIAAHAHRGIFQMILLLEGQARVTIDGVDGMAEAPALILVPNGCVHAFVFGPGVEGWVLSAASQLLRDPRLRRTADVPLASTSIGALLGLDGDARALSRLDWAMSEISAQALSEHGGVSDLMLSLFGLVLFTAEDLYRNTELVPAGGDTRLSLVHAFEALIDRHHAEHWPVSRYAAALSVTPVTLTRACRETLGKPPGEVVLDRLLLEAMRYLRHTVASAKQISGRLGFSDPAYFSRFFKTRAGMTAGSFRRKAME